MSTQRPTSSSDGDSDNAEGVGEDTASLPPSLQDIPEDASKPKSKSVGECVDGVVEFLKDLIIPKTDPKLVRQCGP